MLALQQQRCAQQIAVLRWRNNGVACQEPTMPPVFACDRLCGGAARSGVHIWRGRAGRCCWQGRRVRADGGAGGPADGRSGDGTPPVGEDVLSKLRQYEEDNRKLKAKLAAQASAEPAAGGEVRPADKRKSRVDGSGMQRETLFGGGRSAWLSEQDVEFFTGGAHSVPRTRPAHL